jgi:cytochrome c-type biogenesis protein
VDGVAPGTPLAILLPLAVLAGLVSFASPCVLPLVPGYLAYVGGFTDGRTPSERTGTNRGRLMLGVSLFVLGFSVIFVLAGAAFGAVGFWFIQYGDLLTRILGGVVVLMGLVFVGSFSFMQRNAKLRWAPATGLAGAPLLGAVFAVGWTPCTGPTLSAITALSVNGASPWLGALLAFVYSLGLGIPFVLIALGLSWATGTVSFLKRHVRAINLAGGVLLILIGALMVSGLWTNWMYQLQAVIPGFVTPV